MTCLQQVISSLLVHGELLTDFGNRCLDFRLGSFKILGSQGHTVGDLFHFLFAQTTGSHCSSTNTDAAGDGGFLGIIGNGILIQDLSFLTATLSKN